VTQRVLLERVVKVSALATVLTLARFGKLRAGSAASAGVGRPDKPVCQAEKLADGTVVGGVRPEQVPSDEPLAGCDRATSIILFQMDVIHKLTVSEMHPDAVTTAYGPLADFITITRGAQSNG
jgi:homoserine dehydrogenase